MSVLLCLCTCPDETSAQTIADALVAEHLAACVQRIGAVASTYRWRAAIQHDAEVLLLIKTTRARFAALRDRVVALHPYELPELIAVKVADGLGPYLDWVAAETAAPSPE